MNEQNLRFAPLGSEHLDQLMCIEQLSFATPWSRDSYAHELEGNALAHYYGCFYGEQLLGFGGYWYIADEGHITNVAVHPEYRNQCLGEWLVQRIMACCMAQGGQRMTLEVRESNLPAQRLYSKCGFCCVGSRPNYYDDPKEAAIIMWKELRPTQEDHDQDTSI